MNENEKIEQLLEGTQAPCVREGSHRAQLKAELVEAMQGKEMKMKVLKIGPRTKFRWAVAVTAVMLVGILALISPKFGATSVAFGQVVQQIVQIRTIVYRTELTAPKGKRPYIVTKRFFKAPGLWREEFDHNTSAIIIDKQAHKILHYFPGDKTYFIDNLPDWPNVLNRIAEIKANTVEVLPEKDLAGHRVAGFKASLPNDPTTFATIWADAKTALPVEVEFKHADGYGARWCDFQYDVPLDDELFSLTPPAGYTIKKPDEK